MWRFMKLLPEMRCAAFFKYLGGQAEPKREPERARSLRESCTESRHLI